MSFIAAAGLVLSVFRRALQRLCLLVDGPEAAVALRFTQSGPGVLQLLLQRIDLVALRLERGLLGLELHPQLSEVPLTFIGCCDRLLEGDNRNLGIGGNFAGAAERPAADCGGGRGGGSLG